jgi:hypothetical protein
VVKGETETLIYLYIEGNLMESGYRHTLQIPQTFPIHSQIGYWLSTLYPKQVEQVENDKHWMELFCSALLHLGL